MIMTAPKIRLLYLISFLDMFSAALVIPVFGAHLRSLGASHFTIGLLNALYGSLQFFSSPIIGSWSDIRGHSSVLKLTIFFCSVAYFVLGATTSIPVILVTRIVLGVFKHVQTLCRTLLSDIIPPEHQLEAFSRLVSVSGIGFIIGPTIGGHLAEIENGFFYTCLLVTLTNWLNLGTVKLLLEDTPHSRKDPNETKSSSSRNIKTELLQAFTELSNVNWIVYWDGFILKFLLTFSLMVHYSSFSLVLTESHDISPKLIGYIISFQALIGALSGFLASWLSRFYQNDPEYHQRTLHAFAVLLVSLVVLSVVPFWWVVFPALVPLSAAGSLLRIATSEIILQRALPEQRGSLIGSGQSVNAIARFSAPLCSGLVVDMFGHSGNTVLKILTTGIGTALSASLHYSIIPHVKKD